MPSVADELARFRKKMLGDTGEVKEIPGKDAYAPPTEVKPTEVKKTPGGGVSKGTFDEFRAKMLTPTKDKEDKGVLSSLGGVIAAVPEVLGAFATGMGNMVYAGLAGMGSAAFWGDVDKGVETVEKLSGKYTYNPRTEAGQALNEIVMKPIEWLHTFASKYGEYAMEGAEDVGMDPDIADMPSGVSPSIAAGLATFIEMFGFVAAHKAAGAVKSGYVGRRLKARTAKQTAIANKNIEGLIEGLEAEIMVPEEHGTHLPAFEDTGTPGTVKSWSDVTGREPVGTLEPKPDSSTFNELAPESQRAWKERGIPVEEPMTPEARQAKLVEIDRQLKFGEITGEEAMRQLETLPMREEGTGYGEQLPAVGVTPEGKYFQELKPGIGWTTTAAEAIEALKTSAKELSPEMQEGLPFVIEKLGAVLPHWWETLNDFVIDLVTEGTRRGSHKSSLWTWEGKQPVQAGGGVITLFKPVVPKTVFHEFFHHTFAFMKQEHRQVFSDFVKKHSMAVKGKKKRGARWREYASKDIASNRNPLLQFEKKTSTNMMPTGEFWGRTSHGIMGTELYAEGAARYLHGDYAIFEMLPENIKKIIRESMAEVFEPQVQLYDAPNVPGKIMQFWQDGMNVKQKVWQWLDVVAKYGRYKEVGVQHKLFHSIVDAYMERGLSWADKIYKMTKGDKVAMHEGVLLAENIRALQKASGPAAEVGKLMREIFEEAKQEYKARGVDVDFKKRILSELTDQLEKADPHLKAEIEAAIKKAENMEFVHIPINMWFEKMLADPARTRGALKVLNATKRKTFSIQDMIDSGAITAESVNAIDILGSYAKRMGRDIALLDYVAEAERAGLVKKTPTEGFYPVDVQRAPLLKGYHASPMVWDFIRELTEPYKKQGRLDRLVTATKMMAFYNPLILPMYDIVQGAMAQGLASWKMPKTIWEGYKHVKTRSKVYQQALLDGMSSKPFANDWISYQDFLNKAKEGVLTPTEHLIDAAKGLVKKEQLTRLKGEKGFKRLPILPDIYNLSWHLAWELDKAVRMGTYLELHKKGFTSRQSAQMAAKFHGDYASVPAETRRALNKVAFTPTFKIVMGKLYGRMIMDSMKTAGKLGKSGASPRRYAMGAAMMTSILLGWDIGMQGMGFERDEFGRRYVKKVRTDQGERELAITWSSPANLPLKYMYRAMDAIEPQPGNPVWNMAKKMKWEIHPLWRVGWEMATGKDGQGRTISNYSVDGPLKYSLKTSVYGIKELVRIFKIADPNKTTAEGRVQLRKEVGYLTELMLRPLAFVYTRAPRDRAKVYRAKNMIKEMRSYIFEQIREHGTVDHRNIDKYRKKIHEILDY